MWVVYRVWRHLAARSHRHSTPDSGLARPNVSAGKLGPTSGPVTQVTNTAVKEAHSVTTARPRGELRQAVRAITLFQQLLGRARAAGCVSRGIREGHDGTQIPRSRVSKRIWKTGPSVAERSVDMEKVNRAGGNGGTAYAQIYTVRILLRLHQSDPFLPWRAHARPAEAIQMLLLTGITVVALKQAFTASFATRQLSRPWGAHASDRAIKLRGLRPQL